MTKYVVSYATKTGHTGQVTFASKQAALREQMLTKRDPHFTVVKVYTEATGKNITPTRRRTNNFGLRLPSLGRGRGGFGGLF